MEIDEALQYFSLGLKYRKFKRPIPSYSSTQASAIARDGRCLREVDRRRKDLRCLVGSLSGTRRVSCFNHMVSSTSVVTK